jgi:Bacterial extracellular solute-binding proteins, family 5 Middle/Binding-protein-dependent transport system inner membrane component
MGDPQLTTCCKPGSLTTLRLHVNVRLPTGPAIPLERRPLLALALLTSACGADGAAHQSGLDYFLSADPAWLDPAVSSDVQSGEVMALLFDNLVQFDPDGQLRPGLATRWEADRSGAVYTFHLRKGATFHDGRPIHGDLGRSYITRRPILTDLLQRFPATLRLAGAAMLFATLVGVSIGIFGAWRRGAGRTAALGAYLGVSFPVYWVGLLLILVFAVTLRWLPPSGAGGLAYLVLPALTLGMRSVAFLSRMTRAAMQEVLQSDFVRTARAKGLL